MLAAAAHLGANAAVLVVIGVALTLFATGAARQHAGLNRWADDADVGRGSAGHEAAGGLAHVGAVETQANSAGSARAKCGRSRTRPATPHSFHPHDVRFRVLEHAGEAPPPSLAGLKDAVYVPPVETVRLLTWFEDYADPDLPYMFHCHVLEHEDRGMMGQFVIVKRGGESAARRAHGEAGYDHPDDHQ